MHKLLTVDVTIPGLKTIAFTVSQFVWIGNPGPAWLVPLAQVSRGGSQAGAQSHLKAPLGEGLLPKLLLTPGSGILFYVAWTQRRSSLLALGWRSPRSLTLQSFSQDAKGGNTVFCK